MVVCNVLKECWISKVLCWSFFGPSYSINYFAFSLVSVQFFTRRDLVETGSTYYIIVFMSAGVHAKTVRRRWLRQGSDRAVPVSGLSVSSQPVTLAWFNGYSRQSSRQPAPTPCTPQLFGSSMDVKTTTTTRKEDHQQRRGLSTHSYCPTKKQALLLDKFI
jgi:hypothetical protein